MWQNDNPNESTSGGPGDRAHPLEDFQRLYLNEPPDPAELKLQQLAREYEETCEAFDQRVCTGRSRDGVAMPVTSWEVAAVNGFAKETLSRLARRAGVSQTKFLEAIRAISK